MVMKRYLLFAFVAICCAIAGRAGEDSDTRPMWGVKAALDINIPGDWHGDAGSVKMYRHGYGFTVGTVCNVYLGNGFYLEPGASLFYDSYSFYKFSVAGEPGGENSVDDPQLYKVGLRVPVVVGYSFSIAGRFPLSVYTGPELSWAFGGEIKMKQKAFADDMSGDLFGHYQRRVDCAWKVGVGFPYGSFLVSIDAAIGLTNLLKTGMSFRENRTSVGLTYFF